MSHMDEIKQGKNWFEGQIQNECLGLGIPINDWFWHHDQLKDIYTLRINDHIDFRISENALSDIPATTDLKIKSEKIIKTFLKQVKQKPTDEIIFCKIYE